MNKTCQFGATILLLVSVTVIFVAPAVDLEPTALRATRLANLLFAVLALAGAAVLGRSEFSLCLTGAAFVVAHLLPKSADLIDLNCTRLC